MDIDVTVCTLEVTPSGSGGGMKKGLRHVPSSTPLVRQQREGREGRKKGRDNWTKGINVRDDGLKAVEGSKGSLSSFSLLCLSHIERTLLFLHQLTHREIHSSSDVLQFHDLFLLLEFGVKYLIFTSLSYY